MEILSINWPTLTSISETIRNGYFWWREKFLRFLSSLQSFLFQDFGTNTAKVKNGPVVLKYRVLWKNFALNLKLKFKVQKNWNFSGNSYTCSGSKM